MSQMSQIWKKWFWKVKSGLCRHMNDTVLGLLCIILQADELAPFMLHTHTRSGVGWKWWWREPRQKSSKLVFFFFQSSFACVVFSCLLIGCTRDGRQCHWFRQGHVTFVANLWFFATKVRAISWLWAECWQQPVMPEILVNEYECLKKLQLKDLVLMLDTSRHKIIHKLLHLATLAAAESCSI